MTVLSATVAGSWYLLCLLLLTWPMRKLPRYTQISRGATLMAVPWAILIAAMIGEPGPDRFTRDFVQAVVALPLVATIFWEWGLVFLLLPFSLIQWVATGEKLINSGKWLCQQFEDYFRAQPTTAITFATCTYIPWLLWLFTAVRVR